MFRLLFSKPGDSTWQEDRPDIDAHSSTQFVYNAHHSLALDMQRQRLPIFKNKDHIIYLLEKYQTLVLVGETGCGKSTQVPQMDRIQWIAILASEIIQLNSKIVML
ncbi:Putative ATP-dependent RNA helicase DHX35 [Acromyrmex echinatior]|uniref:Putative ATP-dependent RNA helicase DHX35 n=1 Tax=Acromyrmex echinatior TaxID=103372 RepID=F4X7R9_ACREC|nr:Putative ATP-dependent RNA helicase DHX35 [Acromyrmex echinatior]